jgi:signal transduction histidine kinase
MQNTAMVLREAASQLHHHRDTLPVGVVEHLTEMMDRRTEMLVRLLGDLSTAHLADRGELDLDVQQVSLPEICRDVVDERQRVVGGGQLVLDVSADATVMADPTRLTQVLDNLITNALRYGGPHVEVRAERRGEQVVLTVRDDGEGIPEHLLDTLFEAYVHGDASHRLGGSGLGLMIVRQLCEAMHGTIEYDELDGTCFTATLPAAPREVDPVPGLHDAVVA